MVALMNEFPQVKLTFNLVPSLLVQLEAFAEERARDWHLDLGLKPAASLTENERGTILSEFFHAPRGRMIDLYPRYAELLAETRQGREVHRRAIFSICRSGTSSPGSTRSTSTATRACTASSGSREISRRRTRSSCATVELEILRRVIPEYRTAAERGQVELSTSPFYHPILPLLCDTDIYLRTHPTAAVPRPPFRHPEDAADHLARARQCHVRLFGHEPAGLWPSEGSVSDAVVELAAESRISVDGDRRGDSRAHASIASSAATVRAESSSPKPLYRAYAVRAGSSQIRCLFRDHSLSDLIGFVYASWNPEAAAADFVNRLVEAGRRFSAASGGEEAVISIILDGENAWEHFEGGGRPFLRALYAKLSGHPELRAVKMSEAAGSVGTPAERHLSGLVDRRQFLHLDWAQRRRSRMASIARSPTDVRPLGAGGVCRAVAKQARQELLIAEGSDWFWWYGDDHSSEHDLEFDDLFRRHLRNVYQMLGQPIPEELFVTNISTGHVPVSAAWRRRLAEPGARRQADKLLRVAGSRKRRDRRSVGNHDRKRSRGAAASAVAVRLRSRAPLPSARFWRLGPRQMLEDGLRCSVNFTTPGDRRLVLLATGRESSAVLYQRTDRRRMGSP